MAASKMRILKGQATAFRISPPMWAEDLALALRFGWNPIGPSTSYLASGFRVSSEQAEDLSAAIGRIFEAALQNPSDFYLMRVDMGELYLLNEFLAGGAFEICDA